MVDDMTIARYIFKSGFLDFHDNLSQGNEAIGISPVNIYNHFVSYFQRIRDYEILRNLEPFLRGGNRQAQIEAVSQCIMHALGTRELRPELKELSMDHFWEVIYHQKLSE